MNVAALALSAFLFLQTDAPPSEAAIVRARLHLAQVELAQLRATLADREARLAGYELTAQQQALVADDKKKRPLARVSLFDLLRGQK